MTELHMYGYGSATEGVIEAFSVFLRNALQSRRDSGMSKVPHDSSGNDAEERLALLSGLINQTIIVGHTDTVTLKLDGKSTPYVFLRSDDQAEIREMVNIIGNEAVVSVNMLTGGLMYPLNLRHD